MSIITHRSMWIALVFALFLSACTDATQINNDSEAVTESPDNVLNSLQKPFL